MIMAQSAGVRRSPRSGGTREFRNDGQLQKRRRRSFELETLDWAMEMVKDDLQEKLKNTKFTSMEPRQAALELLERIRRRI